MQILCIKNHVDAVLSLDNGKLRFLFVAFANCSLLESSSSNVSHYLLANYVGQLRVKLLFFVSLSNIILASSTWMSFSS